MAFITPLLIRIPFGVRLFRFTEKPPYGIKNERLRAIVERQMKEGESSEAGLLTMEGVTVRELHWMNAVVKKTHAPDERAGAGAALHRGRHHQPLERRLCRAPPWRAQ